MKGSSSSDSTAPRKGRTLRWSLSEHSMTPTRDTRNTGQDDEDDDDDASTQQQHRRRRRRRKSEGSLTPTRRRSYSSSSSFVPFPHLSTTTNTTTSTSTFLSSTRQRRRRRSSERLAMEGLTVNKLDWNSIPLCGRETQRAILNRITQSLVSSYSSQQPQQPLPSTLTTRENNNNDDDNNSSNSNNNNDPPPPKWVSIVGRSGTGKSRLAMSVQELLMEHFAATTTTTTQSPEQWDPSCLVWYGKFDWHRPIEPYTAIVKAISDGCQQFVLVQDSSSSQDTPPHPMIKYLRYTLPQVLGPSERDVLWSLLPSISSILEPTITTTMKTATQDMKPLFENHRQDNVIHGKQETSKEKQEEEEEEEKLEITAMPTAGDDPNPTEPTTHSAKDVSTLEDCHEVTNMVARLHYVVRQFVRILGRSGYPLVLVLDDVQWCDPPSMSLIESLVTDSESACSMIVTTCREEDLHDNHPILKLSQTMSALNLPFETITIGNLDEVAVSTIVAMALRSTVEDTQALSEIVYRKTSGNAFFVNQFLQSLVDEELLEFNLGTMQWQWDVAAVQAKYVTENVADLTALKLLKLPAQHQTLLQLAACLGQRFEKHTLLFILDSANVRTMFGDTNWPDDCEGVLDSLVEMTVLEYGEREETFVFVHDQIQKAAFNLIPANERNQLQLNVGKHLLTGLSRIDVEMEDQYYLLAVELCNKGLDLVSESEKLSYAEFNLMAGEKAIKQSAFASAASYMEAGIACLPIDHWADHTRLSLKLYSGLVESLFCVGSYDKMERYMNEVMSLTSISILDKQRVSLIRILSLGAQEKTEEAVAFGLNVLHGLGFLSLSRPGKFAVLKELVKTKLLLRTHSQQTLSALPLLQQRDRIMAMAIIAKLGTMAYFLDPNLYVILYLKCFRWSVKYGVCQHSPIAFATYGAIVCNVLGDAMLGRLYGQIALELADRLGSKDPRSMFICSALIYHWSDSLRSCLKMSIDGHQLGMETGDVEMAVFFLAFHTEALFCSGSMPLGELIGEIRSNCKLMSEHKQEAIVKFQCLPLQLALHMVRGTNNPPPAQLTGSAMNEDDFRAYAQRQNNPFLELQIDFYALQLAYYFEDYDRAAALCRRTKDFGKDQGLGHVLVLRNTFFRGMTFLILAARNNIRRFAYLRRARTCIQQIQQWVHRGNVNGVPALQLLRAELSAVQRHHRTAELFTSAIHSANRLGFVQDQALAHERAFMWYHKQGDSYWAGNHFNNALQMYIDWGAYAKVRAMVHTYGGVLDLTDYSQNMLQASDCFGDHHPLTGTVDEDLHKDTEDERDKDDPLSTTRRRKGRSSGSRSTTYTSNR